MFQRNIYIEDGDSNFHQNVIPQKTVLATVVVKDILFLSDMERNAFC
jgi:hypothetical protein